MQVGMIGAMIMPALLAQDWMESELERIAKEHWPGERGKSENLVALLENSGQRQSHALIARVLASRPDAPIAAILDRHPHVRAIILRRLLERLSVP